MKTSRAMRLGACLAAAGVMSCQESTTPETPGGKPPLVTVRYVCGRNFEVDNAEPVPVTVRFEVGGTGEAGELSLPVRPAAGSPSRTLLTTVTRGPVHLSVAGNEAGDADNAGAACPPLDPSPPEPQATAGEWSAPFEWPVVSVHLHLLPDGRVLAWGRLGVPQVWDPSTGAFTEAPLGTNIFCSGHVFLPDGRLLVAGGHITDEHGLAGSNIFDYSTTSWTPAAPMARGRWYPTTTT
ncbi:MAG: hypothetical protein ACRDS0_42525, partial [Pseudonocardiaceae bacterium]